MEKEEITKDIDKKELDTSIDKEEGKEDVVEVSPERDEIRKDEDETNASSEGSVTEKEEQDQDIDNEVSKEDVRSATFQKGSGSKRSLFIVIAVVVVLALVLLWRGLQEDKYVNPVYGYSYNYPENVQLVSSDNIPTELALQGYGSMADLGLTDGDSFLIYSDEDTGDNVVYTILELSARESYMSFDAYKEALFAELERTKQEDGIEYEVVDSIVGKNIESIEYYFEAEIPIDELGNTRTGVFYDNLFKVGDNSYSISFGYPKDTIKTGEYMGLYRDVISSFKVDENFVAEQITTEEIDNENSTTSGEEGDGVSLEESDVETEVTDETEEETADETVEE